MFSFPDLVLLQVLDFEILSIIQQRCRKQYKFIAAYLYIIPFLKWNKQNYKYCMNMQITDKNYY